MKFYKRDPHTALEGMSELTLEQVGAYNLLIDLLYARDGLVPDDDKLVARLLHRDPRTWRTMKRDLMAAGKIQVTASGLLTANGVDHTRSQANLRSEITARSARHRWEIYRLSKQFNGRPMQTQCVGNATKTNSKNSSTSLEAESVKQEVDNGDNANEADRDTTSNCAATSAELKANIQRKWLGR
jgi:uncharacterized protein YdaU (DUF1376 family)